MQNILKFLKDISLKKGGLEKAHTGGRVNGKMERWRAFCHSATVPHSKDLGAELQQSDTPQQSRIPKLCMKLQKA